MTGCSGKSLYRTLGPLLETLSGTLRRHPLTERWQRFKSSTDFLPRSIGCVRNQTGHRAERDIAEQVNSEGPSRLNFCDDCRDTELPNVPIRDRRSGHNHSVIRRHLQESLRSEAIRTLNLRSGHSALFRGPEPTCDEIATMLP